MIDSNSQFFAILTAVGEAKQANATALGVPWTFKEMAVGDANGADPIPSRTQTKLINEWRRAPVNQVRTDPANPNIIITEQVIPSDVGGSWIREIGLFDADGDLVAVANCAPSFKPLLAQGTGKTQVIRMNFIVANTAQIVLKIDPAVVLATRQYVDDSLAAALPADKTPGTYRVVTIDKRGIVVSGSNPTTLSGFGITDGMLKGTGGLGTGAPIVVGAASDLADCRFISFVGGTSTDLPPGASYSVGVHIKFPNVAKNAVEFAGGSPDWLGGRVVGGDGSGVWRKFWHDGNFNPADKANKASTLGGYGITDGATKTEMNAAVSGLLPKAGGAVSGSIILENGAVDSPEIGWRTPEIEARLDVVNKTIRFFTVVNGELAFPLVMNVPDKTASFFGNIAWHAGNFNPESKANKATTLAGYNINDAYTKLQVETVAKAQATETVRGAVRIGTIEDVNAGNDDTAAVTSKKLRWGITLILGPNGAVAFPSWLGGLVIQWGTVSGIAPDTSLNVSFPMAFTTACYSLTSSVRNAPGTTWIDEHSTLQWRSVTNSGFLACRQQINDAGSAAANWTANYIAIGK